MPGLYTIVTRAPGTLVTALIYNTDMQAHVNGRTATKVQSFGASTAQYILTANPFPGAVESLAITLAQELQRWRFVVAALKSILTGGTAVNWFDPINAPGFATIGARVIRAASQSIPNSTATPLNFTGSTDDFNSGVWVSGSPTRFTAPSDGKYAYACSVLWAANATGERRIVAGVNGSFDEHGQTDTLAGVSHTQYQAVTGVLDLTAGDYVEFAAFQTSGGALNVVGESAQSIVGALVFLGSELP